LDSDAKASKPNPQRVKEFRQDELKTTEDILNLCRGPQEKAVIMQQNNFTDRQLDRWLQRLSDQGLIVECGGEVVITPKGQLVLDLLEKLRGFFGVNQT
jgi:predicted transcriptional regulator